MNCEFVIICLIIVLCVFLLFKMIFFSENFEPIPPRGCTNDENWRSYVYKSGIKVGCRTINRNIKRRKNNMIRILETKKNDYENLPIPEGTNLEQFLKDYDLVKDKLKVLRGRNDDKWSNEKKAELKDWLQNEVYNVCKIEGIDNTDNEYKLAEDVCKRTCLNKDRDGDWTMTYRCDDIEINKKRCNSKNYKEYTSNGRKINRQIPGKGLPVNQCKKTCDSKCESCKDDPKWLSYDLQDGNKITCRNIAKQRAVMDREYDALFERLKGNETAINGFIRKKNNEINNLCNKSGLQINDKRDSLQIKLAKDICKKSCSAHDSNIDDSNNQDGLWYKTNSCAWVAEDPKNRCSSRNYSRKSGRLVSGMGSAHNSCKKSCGTC